MHTVVVKGPFTTDELRQIFDLIKQIEAERPTETFEVYINAPEMEGEVEDIIAEINPLRYGYERMIKYRRR